MCIEEYNSRKARVQCPRRGRGASLKDIIAFVKSTVGAGRVLSSRVHLNIHEALGSIPTNKKKKKKKKRKTLDKN
jgi:hypothetical protein